MANTLMTLREIGIKSTDWKKKISIEYLPSLLSTLSWVGVKLSEASQTFGVPIHLHLVPKKSFPHQISPSGL
jgi:hypothetical protein